MVERQFVVKRKFINLAVMLAVLAVGSQIHAQTRSRNTAQPAPTLIASLPESAAVAQVKVKQLRRQWMPQILANNPAKLSEVNASIDRFKDRTGLAPRMFQQIALGVKNTHPPKGK